VAISGGVLSRYERLRREERYGLLMAFDYTKDKLELENGEFAVWRDEDREEDKAAVARQLLRTAEESFDSKPDGACGAGLSSFYLEAQTFPAEQSKPTPVNSGDTWDCSTESPRQDQNRSQYLINIGTLSIHL
jgi:hypothetical protein